MFGKILVILSLTSSLIFTQQVQWSKTNGPPDVGITCLKLNQNGILLAGSVNDYLYRSTDDGNSWQNISNGFLYNGIYDITERINGDIYVSGYGIYMSTDEGLTWNSMGPSEHLQCIVTNSSGHIFAGGWAVVYRSTDNGATWQPLSQNLPNAFVDDMVIDSNNNLIIGTSFGIYRSTDNGNNWIHIGKPEWITNGIYFAGLELNSQEWIFVLDQYEGVHYSTNTGATWINTNPIMTSHTSFGVDVNNNIYVGNFDGYLYSSSDLGQSWFRINQNYNFSPIYSFNLELPNSIIVGTDHAGIFHSYDLGNNWSQKNNGLKSAIVFDLETNSLGDIFARTGNYIYRSTNDGIEWIPTYFSNDVEADFLINSLDHIFASKSFTPGDRSTDFGNTWTSILNGLCCYISAWGEDPIGDLYASGAGLFKSTDNGDSWTQISSVDGLQTFGFYDQNIMFGGNTFGTILRSTNGGFSWDSVGTAGAWKSLWKNLVTDNQSLFLISHDRGGVHRSTDGGNNWTYLTNGLTDSLISNITQTPNGAIFVSTYNDGVFQSLDNGESWSPVNSGLPDTSVYSIKASKNGFLYAGSASGGVYKSDIPVPVELITFYATVIDNRDVILNWSTVSETNNSEFQIQRSKDRISFEVIGAVQGSGTTTEIKTYNYSDHNLNPGIYHYRLKQINFDGTHQYSNEIVVNVDLPLTFSLDQNYPNPFNPTTKIKFSIPQTDKVTLKIYNILGKEVSSLINEVKSAGNYLVDFSAEHLSSGIYFYTLQWADNVQTKKMILIK